MRAHSARHPAHQRYAAVFLPMLGRPWPLQPAGAPSTPRRRWAVRSVQWAPRRGADRAGQPVDTAALAALGQGGMAARPGGGRHERGIVCALAAYKALHQLGLQPAGIVGFNAVLEEENTGNGTLATLHALQNGLAKAMLTDLDAVIIPEPFAETVMSAQVGVCWLKVELTGRPAHVAYMGQGINPIEAGIAVMDDLRQMEADWNAPEHRH